MSTVNTRSTLTARVLGTVVDSARAIARLRTWFDPQIDAAARPLEIREAIIEQVAERTEPSGGGRRVLPHNHVVVTILAADKEERATLQATLADLENALAGRLREVRCQRPAGFGVTVQYLKRPRTGWPPEQRLSVEYESRSSASASTDRPEASPTLRISVVRGQATQSEYSLADSRICIGRSSAPTDDRGRHRRNQIAFLDEGDEHTRTVGRAHASIHYDASRGEYRLFDEGSRNGTRVVRNGVSLDVVPSDPVGVVIRSGDEIQFGTAAVGVTIETRAERSGES